MSSSSQSSIIHQQTSLLNEITFHQTSKFVSIIYNILVRDKEDYLDVEFQNELTVIKFKPSASNKFTLKIHHPSTSSLSNSFTISDKNLVIILEKKDKELEWQSLIFKYKDEDEDDVQLSIKENKEVMVERWFLTRNNVQRCSQILENESKWITSLQAKHDKNVITVNLKTNHSISKNTE
ncbi:1647_t:CDS:2 [Entrophospora sp. SA101]|nr:751_t:CDS:2 [Entrophospora sp. SA101]CAJ0836516.1 15319_t:CDS:2 [Entrophospora sp. SA101]CAJ0898241.1 1647_t:CDS:2 [Entrophospora sp. SA101]